jgi:DNA-binding transcriptional ArsR family regulator
MSAAAGRLSDDYLEYLGSPEWAVLRRAVLRRDGYACRVCNSKAQLDAHHRTYQRFGHEYLADLTTLCRPCHDVFHEAKRLSPVRRVNAEPRHAAEREALRRSEDLVRAIGPSRPVARVPTTGSEVQAAILDALKAGPLTRTDIAHRTGVNAQVVGRQLTKLRARYKVEKTGGGWRLPKTGRAPP